GATPEAGLVALEVEAAGVLVKPVNAARAGGLIGRLVERHRRRHEQQEFTEKLRTLSALSGLITSARDTQEVFKALARAATMLLGARLVHVWVDDPRAQVLRVRGTYGLDPEFERPLTEYEVISYGSGMAGGTFTAGRPEFIFGVRTSPRWKNRRLAEAAGLHAYAGLPLMAGDRTLGVLAIVFGERGEVAVEEKEPMQRPADLGADGSGRPAHDEAHAACGREPERSGRGLRPAADRRGHRAGDGPGPRATAGGAAGRLPRLPRRAPEGRRPGRGRSQRLGACGPKLRTR